MIARNSAGVSHEVGVEVAAPYSSLIGIDVSALSQTGHIRENNEDHYLITRLGRTLQTLSTSLPAGEVPERTKSTTRDDRCRRHGRPRRGRSREPDGDLALIGPPSSCPTGFSRWTKSMCARSSGGPTRFQEVGAMLIERGQRDPALRGMGTTLTAARSLGGELQITHVGDSRVYLLRGGSLHRLTRDHTYAQLLVDIGQLAPGDVAASRHRHVLTNALGGSNEAVQVDVDRLHLEDGDRLLLCSDGLTDQVDDEAITRILLETTRSSDACERLVQRALDGGGRDNVTVIVAAYRLPERSWRKGSAVDDASR